MAQIASIDFGLERIYLHLDTVTNGFDTMLAYFEVNALIIANAAYQQYISPLSAEGNIPKGGGKFTPRYVLMQTGWRFVPYSLVAHGLSILVEPVSAEGLSGRATFDRNGVVVNIDIDEAYEKIEIREVNTGGTTPALTPSQSAQLVKVEELHKAMDLDATKPNVYADDASSVVNADFTLTKTNNGNGTFNVQRS